MEDLSLYDLYIGNLGPGIRESEISNLFSRIGMICSVRVMRHAVTHESRGFAYLTYVNPEHGFKAIKEFNNNLLYGSKIKVLFKQQLSVIPKECKVIIEGLDLEVKEEKIREVCEKFGEIVFIDVRENYRPGEISNVALVYFLSFESASKCIDGLKDFKLNDKKLQVRNVQSNNKVIMRVINLRNYQEVISKILKKYGNYYEVSDDESEDSDCRIITICFENDSDARYFMERHKQSPSCLKRKNNRERHYVDRAPHFQEQEGLQGQAQPPLEDRTGGELRAS